MFSGVNEASGAKKSDAVYETFRIKGWRRRMVIMTAGFLVVAVVLGFVTALTQGPAQARAGLGAGITGVIAIVSLVYAAEACWAFTRCGPDGIRSRGWGLTGSVRWSEVRDITQEETSMRGVSSFYAVVTTTLGYPIRLGVPVNRDSGPTPSREFTEQFERIKAHWQAAVAAGNVPPAPASDELPHYPVSGPSSADE